MIMFYVMYSAHEEEFRGPTKTAQVVIRFAQKGISEWTSLYQYWPTLWIIIVAGTFVLITLFLNNLTFSIMLSHKKEMDLFQNANFHEFWTAARNKRKEKNASDSKNADFNPAKAGESFAEPKDDD